MRQRGRRSLAAQAVLVEGSFGKRPDPPGDLTERQAEIWREIVASEPAEFFGTAAVRGLLADYCRHREAGEMISGVIDGFAEEQLFTYEGSRQFYDLLKMRDLETKASGLAATRLRLTNQSRYRDRAAYTAGQNAAPARKPWEA